MEGRVLQVNKANSIVGTGSSSSSSRGGVLNRNLSEKNTCLSDVIWINLILKDLSKK